MLHKAQTLLVYVEPTMCFVALCMLFLRKQQRQHIWVACLLGTRLLSTAVLMLLIHPDWMHMSDIVAYQAYFYIYWASYAVEACMGFGIILSIYRLSMEPLPGLQWLGMIMFRWAAAISAAIAGTIAIGPNVSSMSFIMRAVSEFQQIQSVLTLCMLVFVCIAIHPMGLSFKSRIFGVCGGLGILATTDLVSAAWLPHEPAMANAISAIASAATCLTLGIWITYFAMPEPERKMILLPTTSPFFVWNQISMALGDAPGFVAVGKVSTDLFAPAELEVMRRASVKIAKADELKTALNY